MKSEFDRELAKQLIALWREVPCPPWLDVSRTECLPNYTHQFAVGVLIAAIEALPGVAYVDLVWEIDWARPANAYAHDRHTDQVGYAEGACRGEALARLLIVLSEGVGDDA